MPELPEVETIRRQLVKVLVGQKIKKIKVLRKKSLQGDSLKVGGRRIKKVERRAKLLVIALTGKQYLMIHLKMTGQLVYVVNTEGSELALRDRPDVKSGLEVRNQGEYRIVGGHPSSDWVGKLPSRHTRVIIELEKGTLFFNDMRGFGWIKIMGEEEKEIEINKFGPDVNSRQFNFNYLKQVLKNSGRAVKVIILDQHKIGGIGNIYANDGLYLAKINPKKPSNKVKEDEIKRLCKALKVVIKKGIKLGGASERNFIHVDGMGGSYQKHFLIYGRDGKKCRRCKGIIKKEKVGGRGTYYCPRCQK